MIKNKKRLINPIIEDISMINLKKKIDNLI